ncbi:unnamed protein product, partial [Ectocarpus sp. 12 AP-2014]
PVRLPLGLRRRLAVLVGWRRRRGDGARTLVFRRRRGGRRRGLVAVSRRHLPVRACAGPRGGWSHRRHGSVGGRPLPGRRRRRRRSRGGRGGGVSGDAAAGLGGGGGGRRGVVVVDGDAADADGRGRGVVVDDGDGAVPAPVVGDRAVVVGRAGGPRVRDSAGGVDHVGVCRRVGGGQG